MSNTFSVTLPSGESWTPTFVTALDDQKCIGCGRCFKVCPRGVLELFGLTEDGERIAVAVDDYDDDEEYEKKVIVQMYKLFAEPTKQYADHIIDVTNMSAPKVLSQVESIIAV